MLLQSMVLRWAAGIPRERDLWPTQPALELRYTAYNLFIAPFGLARTPRRW